MWHGFCSCVISDQGREFCNQVLYELTGTEHRVTSAYHPQSNGLSERFNQTLIDSLVKRCHDNQHDWDRHIDSILFAYRTSKQRSTKLTPFFVMHIREANLGAREETELASVGSENVEEKMHVLINMKEKVDNIVDIMYVIILRLFTLFYSVHYSVLKRLRKQDMMQSITLKLQSMLVM